MKRAYAEPAFDALLTLAVAFGFGTYMLGVFVDPIPAVAVSLVAVLVGTAVLAPAENRLLAGVIGVIAVSIAGVLVPRYSDPGFGLLASGVLLVLVFAALRVTTFRPDEVGNAE